MLTDPAGVNDLTSSIIAGAIRVHRDKGPGLLESVYQECMEVEVRERGLRLDQKVLVPLTYRGRRMVTSYELDLLVENRVIVEIKSVAALAPVHSAQVLTYLKLTGRPVGLLINFNVPVLKEGVRRLLNPEISRRAAPGGARGDAGGLVQENG